MKSLEQSVKLDFTGVESSGALVWPACPYPRRQEKLPTGPRRFRRWERRSLVAVLMVTLFGLGGWELTTGRVESVVFSALASHTYYRMGLGPSPRVRFPENGPSDRRLGYTRIREFTARVMDHGFAIAEQVRISPLLAWLIDAGVHPIYSEKTRT